MNIVTLSNGSTLSIEPLFSSGDIAFNKFELNESVGGTLPDIELSVRTTKDICKLGDILKFKIVNESGWCNEFEAYIYQLSYINTNLTLKLTGCNPEFIRTNNTITYNGVNEVLNGTYKFEVDSNVNSDLVNNLKLYQINSTNYKFLTNVMHSYRKDIIWGYAAGKLMIRDLKNWKSEFEINSKEATSITDEQSISDPSRLSMDIEVLQEFTNFVKIRFGRDIFDVDKNYIDLLQNRLHNQKYSLTKSSYEFSTKYIAPLIICSNVNIINNETSVDNCFVTDRRVEIADTDLHCVYQIKSINP